MLTIIIGIILAGGIFCICYFFLIDSDYEEFALPGFAISFLLLVISLILGLFVPIQGFDEKTLEKETSLVVFSDNKNSDDYGIYLYSIEFPMLRQYQIKAFMSVALYNSIAEVPSYIATTFSDNLLA